MLKWILRFSQPFIASWTAQLWLKAAKLTCPCNTLRTPNSFTRSDTGVIIDSEPHPSRTCKTSLLFAPLAVRVQAGCSALPFYTPTKPLIQLYFKYKTVLFPKLRIFFIFQLCIIKCSYKHSIFGMFMDSWILRVSCNVDMKASLTLQETRSIHEFMNIPKLEFISSMMLKQCT